MFCPNCGSEIPEEKGYCQGCGFSFFRQSYAPAPAYPQCSTAVSKKEFLSGYANSGTRSKATLSRIVMLLSLALLLASIAMPIFRPVYDIPVMDWAVGKEEMKADMQEFRQDYLEMEADFAEYGDELPRHDRNAVKTALKLLDKLTSNISFFNLLSVVDVFEDDLGEYADAMDLEEMDDVQSMLLIVVAVILAAFVLPLLFTLLAGLKKSTGCAVAAMLLTVLPQLLLSGYLLLVLSLVANIYQIVLCKAVNRDYRSFCAGRYMR